MSLAQGFPSTFSDTQKTNEVLHNLDNETKKIYNDVNAIMAADGHAHTGNGSDGALINDTTKLPLAGGTLTGVLNEFKGANIASASTINLTTATGNLVHITGTTTITAVTLASGRREVIFDGILTLTHHATNNNLPGAVNITTAAGDRATYWSDGTTRYCTKYQKANGQAVISAAIASSAQAITGTDNTVTITPLQLRNGLNASGTAPIYACRAWVNFNGTGVVAIMASGNVSSITDNGTGKYTINFTTSMSDTNYAVIGSGRWYQNDIGAMLFNLANNAPKSTSSVQVSLTNSTSGSGFTDSPEVNVAIFR